MVSPPAPSELELVHRALQHLRPGLDPALARRLRTADWAAASVEEGGQFHRVLVLEDVGVLRMTRAHEVGAVPAARWAPCLLYTSPSPRDQRGSRMPSSA